MVIIRLFEDLGIGSSSDALLGVLESAFDAGALPMMGSSGSSARMDMIVMADVERRRGKIDCISIATKVSETENSHPIVYRT